MQTTTKDNIEIIYWTVSLVTLMATIWVIYYSPIKAVKIGRQLNDEQNADKIKRELFLRLFALRGKPLHQDFVDGLNQINVVFHDVPEVLSSWNKYFESLNNNSLINENETRDLNRANLLSVIAKKLGYSIENQTEILTSYYPQVHHNQFVTNVEMRNAEYNFHLTGKLMHESVMNS
jgi:hypothetical protein